MENKQFLSDTDSETSDTDEGLDFPRRHETSLLLAVKAAVKQEDDVIDFLKHVFAVFRQSSSFLVCRTLITVLALVIIIIGVLRFHACPFEQELPLFLVLEGVVLLLKSGLTVVHSCRQRQTDDGGRNVISTVNSILTLFVVLWTLTGSVWTFGIFRYVDLSNPDETLYCDWLVFTCALTFLCVVYTCCTVLLLTMTVLSIYYTTKHDGDVRQLPYEIHVQR